MKIYNGWVIKYSNNEYKVVGKQTIRKSTAIILKNLCDGKLEGMNREVFVKMFNEGDIEYIRSEAV